MRLVVLGLSLSSSWGNGHATTYRALLRAFAERGHSVLFLERDVPWYAAHRDTACPDFCRLAFYADRTDLQRWADEVANADAVIVGSYVADGVAIGDWVMAHARGLTCFYDIDTPVTLAALTRGEESYIAGRQIPYYNIYFSFTGGPTLELLRTRYRSPSACALYCSVDASQYKPVRVPARWDLSYLGTYSADRQPSLNRLLLEPARRRPDLRFVVAGPQYPTTIDWPENVERIDHVAPGDHPVFYGSSRFTLNVTRADMIAAGYSPSVRLFEAAACATPLISDSWTGIDTIFHAGEIALVHDADSVFHALSMSDAAARAQTAGAYARVLSSHTAQCRAAELESAIVNVASGVQPDLADALTE